MNLKIRKKGDYALTHRPISGKSVLGIVYTEAKDLEMFSKKLPIPGILPGIYILQFKDQFCGNYLSISTPPMFPSLISKYLLNLPKFHPLPWFKYLYHHLLTTLILPSQRLPEIQIYAINCLSVIYVDPL